MNGVRTKWLDLDRELTNIELDYLSVQHRPIIALCVVARLSIVEGITCEFVYLSAIHVWWQTILW